MSGIGIDFGTTNSAVAWHDGEQVHLVRLEADGPIMPTATYIDQDLQTRTGQAAIDQYIADNTGRTVELVREVVGRSQVLVGGGGANSREAPETVSQDIHGGWVDLGLQGRLFRGVKRLLGDPKVRRLLVFNHPYRLVALITPLLLRMRQAAAQASGQAVAGAHLGHPVVFEGKDEHRNRTAFTRLGEAAGHAGIKGQTFFPEPVAATLSWLDRQPGGSDGLALTLDFGGGTLDLCVLRFGRAGFEVLATHGIGLGGDHIDQQLFREVLFPMLGKGELWRRKGHDRIIETRFPFEEYEDHLLNWTVTYLLNQNRYKTPVLDCIEQAAEGSDALYRFRRLRELITQNHGYLVFNAIKQAKAELSSSEETRLDIPEIDVDVVLTRSGFEAMIAPQLQAVSESIERVLELAGVRDSDVDVVLGTGGSSLIPAVRRILDGHFPGRVQEHDPFTSVAEGLAIAAHRGLSGTVV